LLIQMEASIPFVIWAMLSSDRSVYVSALSDKNAKNCYISKCLIIRHSHHYLSWLLELAPCKPKIRHSILRDRDHSKSLAETQRNRCRQPAESVRVFLWL
jgi:hypothetical protein